MLFNNVTHQSLAFRWLYSFFSTTSFRMRWSMDSSAYMCFKRRFSSSSWRRRLRSVSDIPPNFYARYKRCIANAMFSTKLITGMPASASFKTAMICCSVNRDFFHFVGLLWPIVYQNPTNAVS